MELVSSKEDIWKVLSLINLVNIYIYNQIQTDHQNHLSNVKKHQNPLSKEKKYLLYYLNGSVIISNKDSYIIFQIKEFIQIQSCATIYHQYVFVSLHKIEILKTPCINQFTDTIKIDLNKNDISATLIT